MRIEGKRHGVVSMMDYQDLRLPFVDVNVNPLDVEEICQLVESEGSEQPRLIANQNLHSVYVYWTNDTFRELYAKATVTIIDGWPILALARLVSPGRKLGGDNRVGSTDWVLQLLEKSTHPLRIVAVGGTQESSRGAARMVSDRYPVHTWIAYDGYEFARQGGEGDLSEPKTLLAELESADVVLVGMGMPHQEQWILDNWAHLGTCVVANVGGCFDYFSGVQELAPRWMGAFGIEWLFRLYKSPTRLFRRYLVEPFMLIGLLAKRKAFSPKIGGW